MNMTRFQKITIEEAIKPKDRARVYINKYWSVVNGCVLFFEGVAPQCNSNKDIAEMVTKKLFPSGQVKFLDIVYH